MATASSIDAQLGIVDEVTYGTRVAASRFFELIEESIQLDITRIEGRGIRPGRRTKHRWAPGTKRAAGSFSIELPAQGVGLLLKHLMGTVNTSGTNPYTHVFTPGPLDGKSFTMQIGKPSIDGTVRVFEYVGSKVTEWEIHAAIDEYATLEVSTYSRNEDTSQTLATASYPATLSPFVYTHGALSIAAAELEVMEVTVHGTNNLAIDRHRMSASNPQLSREPKESGRREYTGSARCDFNDLTAYNRFVNGTEAALSLAFNAGASAQLTIAGNVRFDGETPNAGEPAVLEENVPFEFIGGPNDAAVLTLTLINADSTP